MQDWGVVDAELRMIYMTPTTPPPPPSPILGIVSNITTKACARIPIAFCI